MKNLAVTPELFDGRLDKSRSEWKQDLAEHEAETRQGFVLIGQRFDGVDRRLDKIPEPRSSIDDLKNSMRDLQRSLMRYLLGFTLVAAL